MSLFRNETIGNIVTPVSTWSPAQDAAHDFIRYVDLSSVDSTTKSIINCHQVLGKEAPGRARQLVAANDILVSTVRPNLNGVAMVPGDLDGVTVSTGFCVLRPNLDRAYPRYLFQWIKSPSFVQDMVRRATGASYPAVSDKIVLESKIPLPSIDVQRRIAEILDGADVLSTKYRAFLTKIDTLAQSIFVEMFGDPANDPRWPRESLVQLGKVSTGRTPPSEKKNMFEGPIPFVTPGDLENEAPIKRTLTEMGAAECTTVRAGSTLVCCIGATIGKVGRSAARSAFNQQINAVEWFNQIDDAYGYWILRFFKPTIVSWGTSTTLPILKKSAFERIEIPVPPLSLQRAFAERMERIESLKVMNRTSEGVMVKLFQSLQYRAFRGELT